MKAYTVTSKVGESVGEIVNAKNSAEAKTLALRQSEWFRDHLFTDLRAHRFPEADGKFPQWGVVPCSIAVMQFMRDMGWREVDGTCETCENCEKYQWDQLEESWVDSESGFCSECIEELTREIHG